MGNDPNDVVGVRFRNAGKIEYFHAAGMRLDVGESVVVDTNRGPEIGRVVIAPDQVLVNELGEDERRPILRLATDDDIRRADALEARANDTLPEARRLANEQGLDAHIDNAHFTLDGARLTLSYTAENRVDTRAFQKAAGKVFNARVDANHIGARDRAKLAGGYGICGRELCCSSWLTTFPSISIRLAKDQSLPLNPEKISGLCGRLLCCLSYEEEGYKTMRKTLPKMGQRCSTPTGEGKVIGLNILKRQITLLVGRERIEITDRDLGTVVRWDPGSKTGEPPPSITREEGVAQGLVEPLDPALVEAPDAVPEPFPFDPKPKPQPAPHPDQQRPQGRKPRTGGGRGDSGGSSGGRNRKRGGGAGIDNRGDTPEAGSKPRGARGSQRRQQPAGSEPRGDGPKRVFKRKPRDGAPDSPATPESQAPKAAKPGDNQGQPAPDPKPANQRRKRGGRKRRGGANNPPPSES